MRLRAVDLVTLDIATGYLLRSVDDDADDWRVVVVRPRTERRPNKTGVGGPFLPEITTVTYADGSERYFNPDDWFEVRPAR